MGQGKGGAAFMILFGAVFFAVGAGMGVYSYQTLRRAEAVQSWTRTPARVVSCDLRATRGSKGGYTYQAQATYEYEVNGVKRTGDRVSLYSGSDNIGDFQRRTYEALKRSRDGVEATTCWVNPADPADAILVRTLRPEMLILMQLFVLAFGGAGLGVVLTGLGALLRPSGPSGAFGGAGQIRMRGAAAHQIAGALALAVNSYVGWLLWQTHRAMAPAPLPVWFWLIALAGVAPAAVAGYLIGRFRKFGLSVFEMSPLPGVLGGPVNGTIRIPAKVETEAGFEVVLQCVHQYTTRSGKNSTTHRDVLWEDSRHIDGALGYGDETMLPVRFSAPYDKPASTVAGGCNGYYWQLKASAAAPGIDYKAVFDVPLRHTRQSVPDAPQPQAELKTAVGTRPLDEVVARQRLRLEPRSDGGFELIFPAGRARVLALSLAAFAALWTAGCVALGVYSRLPESVVALIWLLDAALLAALFGVLFMERGIIVDRGRSECVAWRRAPGLPRRERTVPFGSVIEVRSENAGQSGRTLYSRVVLAAEGEDPFTIGSGLTLWADAEGLARLVQAGVKPGFSRGGFLI